MILQLIVIQIITVGVNIFLANTENKKKIYFITFLFNVCNLVMYIMNKDLTTSLIYIIISIRSFLYIYREKFKTNIVPYLAILMQLIIGFTTMDKHIQVLSIITPCFSCYYLWFWKYSTQKLRIGNMISNALWGVYNLISGLYIVSISRFVTVLVNILAYRRKREVCKNAKE